MEHNCIFGKQYPDFSKDKTMNRINLPTSTPGVTMIDVPHRFQIGQEIVTFAASENHFQGIVESIVFDDILSIPVYRIKHHGGDTNTHSLEWVDNNCAALSDGPLIAKATVKENKVPYKTIVDTKVEITHKYQVMDVVKNASYRDNATLKIMEIQHKMGRAEYRMSDNVNRLVSEVDKFYTLVASAPEQPPRVDMRTVVEAKHPSQEIQIGQHWINGDYHAIVIDGPDRNLQFAFRVYTYDPEKYRVQVISYANLISQGYKLYVEPTVMFFIREATDGRLYGFKPQDLYEKGTFVATYHIFDDGTWKCVKANLDDQATK